MSVQIELPKAAFNNVIRVLKKSDIHTVTSIRAATYKRLKQIRVPRDSDEAVKGVPRGSDNVDIQSLVKWMQTVTRGNKRAVQQLVAIDATAVARLA